jgi:tRNA G46 methylase TrmB
VTLDRFVAVPRYQSKKRLHLSGAAYGKTDYDAFASFFLAHYGRNPYGAEIVEWARLHPQQWAAAHPEEKCRRRR